MFIAMLLYQDGIQTIIRMAGVYGAEVGIDQNSQIAAFVMVQFVGIPFAFMFGALGSRIGTKRCIFIAIGAAALSRSPFTKAKSSTKRQCDRLRVSNSTDSAYPTTKLSRKGPKS